MRTLKLVLLTCCIAASSKVARAVTTILGTGGNLPAAIAAAGNNDVIELQSNGTFTGNLTWSNKYLTIRAGAGFHPTIQGNIASIQGNSLTGGTFQGLNVTGNINASTTGDTFANYLIENTILQAGANIGGTGNFHVTATINRSELSGDVLFGGTGGFRLDLTMNHDIVRKSFIAYEIANDVVYNLNFYDNDFLTRPLTWGGNDYGHRNVVFSRNRLRQGVDLLVGTFNNVNITMTDNVLGDPITQSSITDPGLFVRSQYQGIGSHTIGHFYNNTVAGFTTGVGISGFAEASQFSADFANMLLRNVDDLSNVSSSQITYSLISDGTYNGVGNNFAGVPLLGPDGQLLNGSPGIDRGNNAKASMLDFFHNTRIRDGNGDGVKVVDVGAVELLPEPSTIFLVWLAVAIATSRRCTATRERIHTSGLSGMSGATTASGIVGTNAATQAKQIIAA